MLSSNSVQEAARLRAHRAQPPRSKRAFRSCTSSTASAPRTRSPRSSPSRRRPSAPCSTRKPCTRPPRARAFARQPRPPRHAQNPDVFFQAREACNPYYLACPAIVQDVMDRFPARPAASTTCSTTYGAPDADRVIILMGSGAGARRRNGRRTERRRAKRSGC